MKDESLQVGAVGAKIEVTLTEFDHDSNSDVASNLSSAVTLQIHLKRPDNTKVVKSGILSTNGLDGKMYFYTEVDDLNLEGTYYVQGYVVSSGWDGYSSVGKFEVHENL